MTNRPYPNQTQCLATSRNDSSKLTSFPPQYWPSYPHHYVYTSLLQRPDYIVFFICFAILNTSLRWSSLLNTSANLFLSASALAAYTAVLA